MLTPELKALCDQIRETAYAIHCYHRHGHLEPHRRKIYQNALVHRLQKQGLKVESQKPLNVYDEDGTLLGEFFADLIVEGKLLIELKAVSMLLDEHVAQVLGYLRSSRIEDGLLINFGSSKLQIRKYILNDAFRSTPQPQEL